ncbi:transcriptional activator RinB [Staphylococcus equorum]|uniref:transcriptional activator RinB n=1 Tax=Staphylococcus equorum TaxID=246432 RepID=UPI003594460C
MRILKTLLIITLYELSKYVTNEIITRRQANDAVDQYPKHMAKYKVQFEVPYMYQGVIPIMYHPSTIVEADSVENAKVKAQEVFNSHPDNVDLTREIVAVTIKEDE